MNALIGIAVLLGLCVVMGICLTLFAYAVIKLDEAITKYIRSNE